MKSRKIFDYFIAYVLWVVTLGLGIWLILLSREALEAFLGGYYIKGENQFMLIRQARFLDIAIPFVLWLLWFAFLIIIEEYYRKGAEKRLIWWRFARVTGWLLVLIFIVDLIQVLLVGAMVAGWLRWLLVTLELLVGVALLIFSRSKPTASATKSPLR